MTSASTLCDSMRLDGALRFDNDGLDAEQVRRTILVELIALRLVAKVLVELRGERSRTKVSDVAFLARPADARPLTSTTCIWLCNLNCTSSFFGTACSCRCSPPIPTPSSATAVVTPSLPFLNLSPIARTTHFSLSLTKNAPNPLPLSDLSSARRPSLAPAPLSLAKVAAMADSLVGGRPSGSLEEEVVEEGEVGVGGG